MAAKAVMSTSLREVEVGTHRGNGFHQPPASEQTAFSFDAKARVEADQIQLRALFAAMVRAAGGVDWLVAALDREPSYTKKVTDAINGATDRKVQLDWIAPLLDDPKAADLLIGWLCDRLGYAPPVRERKVTQEQIALASLDVLREMAGPLAEPFKQAIAKQLGVRVEDVKF